jgi:hypothetical protein
MAVATALLMTVVFTASVSAGAGTTAGTRIVLSSSGLQIGNSHSGKCIGLSASGLQMGNLHSGKCVDDTGFNPNGKENGH